MHHMSFFNQLPSIKEKPVSTTKALVLILLTSFSISCSDSFPDNELAQYKGEWLVINYWAEWCKPCREEIAELNLLQEQYDNSLEVLGVNYDGATGEALEQQMQALKVAFIQLKNDPAAQLETDRPAVLPTTFIVSPDGKLQSTLLGPQTKTSILKAIGLETKQEEQPGK